MNAFPRFDCELADACRGALCDACRSIGKAACEACKHIGKQLNARNAIAGLVVAGLGVDAVADHGKVPTGDHAVPAVVLANSATSTISVSGAGASYYIYDRFNLITGEEIKVIAPQNRESTAIFSDGPKLVIPGTQY
jgi:hypothetical protein